MERFENLPLSPFVANAFFWRRRLLYTFTPAPRFLSYFTSMKAEELKFGAKVKVVKTLDGLSDKRRSSFIGQTGAVVGFFALSNVIKEKTRFSISLRFGNSLQIEEFDLEELELEKDEIALDYLVEKLDYYTTLKKAEGLELEQNKVYVAGKGDTTTISNSLEMTPTSGIIGVAAQPIKSGESGFVKLFGTFAEETDPEKLKKMADQFGMAGSVGIDGFGNPIIIQPEPPQKNRPGELGERKIEA